ncbi:hypothetical protein IKT64_00820 [Candidatus Saccharibacteria bacterium]|nr:hypothetical protein [Candidatus Saccharibacteria bacterium]
MVDNFDSCWIGTHDGGDNFDFIAFMPSKRITPVKLRWYFPAIFTSYFGKNFGAVFISVLASALFNECLVVIFWIIFFVYTNQNIGVVAREDW